MDDADDRTDVELAKNGDGWAFSRLVRRHQLVVARRMNRFTRDPAAVEELVQDVFVESYYSLKSFRGGGPFAHWLSKIAVRVGYRFWKSRRRDLKRREGVNEWTKSKSPSDVEALTSAQAAELLTAVLDELSPRDRLALVLVHLESRSVAEAAELAGWSQTMMKVQAFRARGRLRAVFERLGIQRLGDVDLEDVQRRVHPSDELGESK